VFNIVISAATLGSIYVLFSLGMSLVWGTIGVLNFAHGAVFVFAVFVNWVLLQSVGLPFAAVLIIGVLVGAALSALFQLLVFRPILKRSADKKQAEMRVLIAGIGLGIIPVGLVQLGTLSNPFGLGKSQFTVESFEILGARVTNIQLIVIAVAIALVALIAWWITKSKSGLALRAIGVDAETSSLMGINEGRLGVIVMAIAGGLAGLAGPLLTYTLSTITAESGDVLLLSAFAAIILGGVGSIGGIVAGAYFLAIVETVVLTYTSGTWVSAVAFSLLFAVLLLRPQGFFGKKEVKRA
jgi:branched-chain amino acid transport system permease protein